MRRKILDLKNNTQVEVLKVPWFPQQEIEWTYNCQFLTIGIHGAGHAGVVIGITENDIIVNNPWLGSEYFISHENFAPAWELEYNQAILLEPNPQTKLGSEGK
jgi:uncharacterized protein YvpB